MGYIRREKSAVGLLVVFLKNMDTITSKGAPSLGSR